VTPQTSPCAAPTPPCCQPTARGTCGQAPASTRHHQGSMFLGIVRDGHPHTRHIRAAAESDDQPPGVAPEVPQVLVGGQGGVGAGVTWEVGAPRVGRHRGSRPGCRQGEEGEGAGAVNAVSAAAVCLHMDLLLHMCCFVTDVDLVESKTSAETLNHACNPQVSFKAEKQALRLRPAAEATHHRSMLLLYMVGRCASR
jgi:hypothetical protein